MKILHAGHVVLVATALFAAAGAADGQRTPCDSPCKLILLPLIIGQGQQPAVYFEYQVDKPVRQAPGSVMPHYPDSLKMAKLDGEVRAAFIVDTTGLADTTSLHIYMSTHRLFSAAVRDALPQMRFIPAELHGVKVKQLVQQPFVFNISK